MEDILTSIGDSFDKLRKADRVGVQVERRRIEDQISMQAVADNTTCLACEG